MAEKVNKRYTCSSYNFYLSLLLFYFYGHWAHGTQMRLERFILHLVSKLAASLACVLEMS